MQQQLSVRWRFKDLSLNRPLPSLNSHRSMVCKSKSLEKQKQYSCQIPIKTTAQKNKNIDKLLEDYSLFKSAKAIPENSIKQSKRITSGLQKLQSIHSARLSNSKLDLDDQQDLNRLKQRRKSMLQIIKSHNNFPFNRLKRKRKSLNGYSRP